MVMQVLYRTVVVKTYLSVYILTLSYGHEPRIETENTRSWIQAAGMRFLWRVAALRLRDRVSSSDIWWELGVEPLLFGFEKEQVEVVRGYDQDGSGSGLAGAITYPAWPESTPGFCRRSWKSVTGENEAWYTLVSLLPSRPNFKLSEKNYKKNYN